MEKEFLQKQKVPLFLGMILLILGTGCPTVPMQGEQSKEALSDDPLFLPSDLSNSDNILQCERARISYPDGWRALPRNKTDSSTVVLNLKNEDSSISVRIDRLTFPFPVFFERFTELLSSRIEDTSTLIGHSEAGPAAIIEAANSILLIQEFGKEIWITEALIRENSIDDQDRNALFQIAASMVPDSAHLTYRQRGTRLTVVLLPPWQWIGDTEEGFIIAITNEQLSSWGKVEIRFTASGNSRVLKDSASLTRHERSPFFTIAYLSAPDQDRQLIELSNGVDTIELRSVSTDEFPGEEWLNLLFPGIVFSGIAQ